MRPQPCWRSPSPCLGWQPLLPYWAELKMLPLFLSLQNASAALLVFPSRLANTFKHCAINNSLLSMLGLQNASTALLAFPTPLPGLEDPAALVAQMTWAHGLLWSPRMRKADGGGCSHRVHRFESIQLIYIYRTDIYIGQVLMREADTGRCIRLHATCNKQILISASMRHVRHVI